MSAPRVKRTPVPICGVTFAGNGACTRAPGHDGNHQDAHGFTFTRDSYLGSRPMYADQAAARWRALADAAKRG